MVKLTINEKRIYDFLIKSPLNSYMGTFFTLSKILNLREKELKIAVVNLIKIGVIWYYEDPSYPEDFVIRLCKNYRMFQVGIKGEMVEMTLDEFCTKFNYSENSVRIQFKRTQEQMKKKGFELEKSNDRYPNTKYFVRKLN